MPSAERRPRRAWEGVPASLPVARVTGPAETIDVWCTPLHPSASWIGQLAATLSAEERERVERLPASRAGQFVVSRGVLRIILGRILGQEPASLRFRYGPHGKPRLVASGPGERVQFSVSRSARLVLHAIATDRAVGVDVEEVRARPNWREIAARFFSANELTALRRLPEHEQLQAFYDCWTRKEAYLKARGEGTTRPLPWFDVALAPGEPARLLRVDGDETEASRWSLHALRVADGHAAALCVGLAGLDMPGSI